MKTIFALLLAWCVPALALAPAEATYATCVRQMLISPPCIAQVGGTNPNARMQFGNGLSVPASAYTYYTAMAKQEVSDPGYLDMCNAALVEVRADPASDRSVVAKALWPAAPDVTEAKPQPQPVTVPAGAMALAGVLACSALLFSLGSARREALAGVRGG